MSPGASVVIPTRDRWKWLRSSLAAALGQQDVDVEVVVVDDGSRDETPARLADYGDPRVTVVRHGQSQGLARARNAGIARARGRWIAFLDDDDLWAPDKLARQIAAAEAAGAGWAYARAVLVDDQRAVIGTVPFPDADETTRRLPRWNLVPVGASNVIARADLVERVGAFDEQLTHLADWDLWMRFSAAAPVAACPDVLVAYTMHSSNMHSADTATAYGELERLEARGVDADRVLFARWVAWGHRRAGRRLAASRVYLASAVRDRDPGNAKRAARALLGARPLRRGRVEATAPDPGWLAAYR